MYRPDLFGAGKANAPAPGINVQADASFLMSGGRVVRGMVEGGSDPQAFIPALTDHHKAGRFPFDRLVRYFDFADIAKAIEAGESGQVIKLILLLPCSPNDIALTGTQQ